MSDPFGDDDLIPDYSADPSTRIRSLFAERGLLIVAIGATIGSLALLCVFAYLLINSDDEKQPPTPTPDNENVTQEEVNTDEFVYVAISGSGAISVTMETPIFLGVAGEEFSVQAEVIPEEGAWTPVPANETTAVWVYGSVINYIFGLDDTNENQALLERLAPGDEIVLTSRSGRSLTFAVSSRKEVNSENRTIFAQQSPGVTLLLIEEDLDEQRIVVDGRFVASDANENVQGGRVVAMGETAQLEGLQITVTGVSFQYDRPEIPGGFAFYMVDYQIQNVSAATVSSDLLNMVLADDFGNLYAQNPVASTLGNYPPLTGSIDPGQSVSATAGYQIPTGLTSTTLRWQVTMVSTGSQIQVNIPFQEGGDSGQQANITLENVTVSPDGGSLIIVGQITNLGEQSIVVDVNNLSLSSGAAVYLIQSTNPAFPWVIDIGQTLVFQVTYQRPLAPTATFTILNQSFELSGLQ